MHVRSSLLFTRCKRRIEAIEGCSTPLLAKYWAWSKGHPTHPPERRNLPLSGVPEGRVTGTISGTHHPHCKRLAAFFLVRQVPWPILARGDSPRPLGRWNRRFFSVDHAFKRTQNQACRLKSRSTGRSHGSKMMNMRDDASRSPLCHRYSIVNRFTIDCHQNSVLSEYKQRHAVHPILRRKCTSLKQENLSKICSGVGNK